MDKPTILVVDDESRMRKLIRDYLEANNYLACEAENGQMALDMFYENRNISMIILDVMMPKVDGWEVLKTIRETSDLPVIMLTALGEERDELLGFRLKVDEYISKPFSPKVLVARVDALLRRTTKNAQITKDLNGLIYDPIAYEVRIEGEPVDLSRKEFELLGYFIDNDGIALSREKILNSVWSYDFFGDERTIDTHVKKLRKKLGSKCEYIQTVRGVGYRFEVIKA